MESDDFVKSINDSYQAFSAQVQEHILTSPHLIRQFDKHLLKYLVNYNEKEIAVSRLVPWAEYVTNNQSYSKMTKELNKIKELSNVQFHRRVAGDGNCFYRAFIYQYFENLIYLCDEIENIIFLKLYFNKIFQEKVYYIKSFVEHFESSHGCSIMFARTVCLAVMKLIITILESDTYRISSDKIKRAYGVYFLNFSYNRVFDNYLICWFRSFAYHYLKDKGDTEITSGTSLYNLIGNTPCMENYKPYLKRNIKTFGEEGETLIATISAFLFKTCFTTIHFKPGTVFEHEYSYQNTLLAPEDQQEHDILPTFNIFLLHTGNHYDAIYPEEFYNKNKIRILSFDLGEDNDATILAKYPFKDAFIDCIFQCKECKLWLTEEELQKKNIIPSCIKAWTDYSDKIVCNNCYYVLFMKQISQIFIKLKCEKLLSHKCFPCYRMFNHKTSTGEEQLDKKYYPLIIPKCFICGKYGCISEEMLSKNNVGEFRRKLRNFSAPVISQEISLMIYKYIQEDALAVNKSNSQARSIGSEPVTANNVKPTKIIDKNYTPQPRTDNNNIILAEKSNETLNTKKDSSKKIQEKNAMVTPGFSHIELQAFNKDDNNNNSNSNSSFNNSRTSNNSKQTPKGARAIDTKFQPSNQNSKGQMITYHVNTKKDPVKLTSDISEDKFEKLIQKSEENSHLDTPQNKFQKDTKTNTPTGNENSSGQKKKDLQNINTKEPSSYISKTSETNQATGNDNFSQIIHINDSNNIHSQIMDSKSSAKLSNIQKKNAIQKMKRCRHADNNLCLMYECDDIAYCLQCSPIKIEEFLENSSMWKCQKCKQGFSSEMIEKFNNVMQSSENLFLQQFQIRKDANNDCIFIYGFSQMRNGHFSCIKCKADIYQCACHGICQVCKLPYCETEETKTFEKTLRTCTRCMIQECLQCREYQVFDTKHLSKICKLCENYNRTELIKEDLIKNFGKQTLFCVLCNKFHKFVPYCIDEKFMLKCEATKQIIFEKNTK